ncbi:hypothetical protein D3C87_990890 [compost metagenome]
MAWPKVWPRLSSARSPFSSGSRATISALCSQLRAIAWASAVSSPASSAACSACSHWKNSGSPMAPYLITSARPARSSRGGRVRSAAVSAITARGGWNAPTRFLPSGMSTAVLPPTEESTIASSEVGSCTQSTPRIQQAAANPARSPATPPPSAITQASRVAPSAASALIAAPKLASVLEASPAGSTSSPISRSGRSASRAALTPARYSGATASSLSSSTWRPRTCSASNAPWPSRPGPMWMR